MNEHLLELEEEKKTFRSIPASQLITRWVNQQNDNENLIHTYNGRNTQTNDESYIHTIDKPTLNIKQE